MRKNIRDNLIEVISTILDAHEVALKYAKSGEIDLVMSVFTECQDAMVKIGEVIEANEGENHKTIEFLQRYCDELYEVSLVIAENNEPNFNKLFKRITLKLKDVHYSIKNDIKIKLEVVFLPYKASMWDSLESVWKAADEDPDCDAYVIPIPYYDRNPDESFGEMHYEGGDFPDYVPVIHYEDYNIEARRPDVIYIHNLYDEFNYITSVDPRFYSSVLKDYTDCLVYIPYFVIEEPNPNNQRIIKKMGDYALKPAVANAHKVIVQSEATREVYMKTIFAEFGDVPEVRSFFENRIISVGSPKFDKIASYKKENFNIPEEWEKIIGNKKVVLYNTHLSLLMVDSYERFLPKLRSVIDYFKTRDDVVLWWRPHPLSIPTAKATNSVALDEYMEIVENFRNGGFGVYDDSPDMERAIAVSDAYYGSGSSMLALYKSTGKPVLVHNINAL